MRRGDLPSDPILAKNKWNLIIETYGDCYRLQYDFLFIPLLGETMTLLFIILLIPPNQAQQKSLVFLSSERTGIGNWHQKQTQAAMWAVRHVTTT